MPDDLDTTILFPCAIAVMELELVRDEGIAQVDIKTFDLSVMIAGEENYIALFPETYD
jgi:hypothetical protein